MVENIRDEIKSKYNGKSEKLERPAKDLENQLKRP